MGEVAACRGGCGRETDALREVAREVALGLPGPLPLHRHQAAAGNPPASGACSFSTRWDPSGPDTCPDTHPAWPGRAGLEDPCPAYAPRSVGCRCPPLPTVPRAPSPGPDGEQVRVKAEPGYLGTRASSRIARGSRLPQSPHPSGWRAQQGPGAQEGPRHQGSRDPGRSPGLWPTQGGLPTSKATKAHTGLAS